MASIQKTSTDSGEVRYRVRYRDPSGASRERWFRRRVDADRFARNVEVDIDRGEWVDPKLGAITVVDWLTEWHQTRQHLRPSTAVRDWTLIERHIRPHLGHRTVGQLKPNEVRSWAGGLVTDGLSPATAKKVVQLLGAALEQAVDDGVIARSPVRTIKLPTPERREMRFLSHGEIAHLADTIDPRYQALVVTAGYSGARFGELAALKIDNINLLRRTLTITETANEVQGNVLTGPPKTTASRRQISLPRYVTGAIAHHLQQHGLGEDGLVFPAPQGGPLRRTLFRRRTWLPAVAASVGEPCRFHDLRHSHAALLIAEQIHPKVLQERLGHTSIRTTLDVYGHLLDGLDEAAADALDNALTRSTVGLSWG